MERYMEDIMEDGVTCSDCRPLTYFVTSHLILHPHTSRHMCERDLEAVGRMWTPRIRFFQV